MRTTRKNDLNIDALVNVIRSPYFEEGADSVHRATKVEIAWAIIKILSCLAVIAIALYCCTIVNGPFWRLVTSIVSMLACFCMHCFAAYKLGNRHDTKT